MKVAIVLALCALTSSAEVVYNNTTSPLRRFEPELREHGDQLSLSGTARTLTDIYVEYFADFVPQGGELVIVRVYTNEKQWDMYRKEPTTLLYQSTFPLRRGQSGYSTLPITSLALEVPDTITITLEPVGLEPGERFGLPNYSPATVGGPTLSGRVGSDNEFWRKTETGWEAYRNPNPDFVFNAAFQLVAVPEPGTVALIGGGAALLAASRRFRRK